MSAVQILKKYAWLMAMFVVMVGLLVANVIAGSSHSEAISLQQMRISQLQSQINVAGTANHNQESTLNAKVSGFDSTRKGTDDRIINDFLSTAMSWSSYEEYASARGKLMRVYGLTEQSPFMSTFMPKVNNVKSSNGNDYNEIDTYGRSSRLQSVRTTVSSIDRGTYGYVALVELTSKDNAHSGTTYDLVTYTINASGKITSITATPISGTPSGASL